jgi:manganese/zinc/iron transport system permease protein
MALMSDAISHSILPGIVIGFFIARNTTNPLVVVAAAASGVITVWLVEALFSTRRVKEDAAIGLVFPALFSIGVILVSQYARGVHLDVDAVLLGELAFAPLNRTTLLGLDLPRGVWVMGGILLLSLLLIALFYKELKLATFDPALAASLGFSPVLLHYGLMTLVSVTAVGAFDHVGSVLVVALMIAPPSAAYLLTRRLSTMLWLSAVIGVVSALGGYWAARLFDTNISGAMATMSGVIFLLIFVFAPEQGLIARSVERRDRRNRFAVEMLLVHLSRHEGTAAELTENTVDHLTTELNWTPEFARRAIYHAAGDGLIHRTQSRLSLTQTGREVAVEVLSR